MGESRIRNATKIEAYGIKFRSKLELYTYEQFKKYNIRVKYEPVHLTLLPKFKYMGESIRAITYCPDFVGLGFIVECKGFANESFPLRFKLFKYCLKDKHNIKCYVVKNHKQVDEMIKELLSQSHGDKNTVL